jgi:hypothetical protein
MFAEGPEMTDHWEQLAEHYPAEAIEDVREVFARRQRLVAA